MAGIPAPASGAAECQGAASLSRTQAVGMVHAVRGPAAEGCTSAGPESATARPRPSLSKGADGLSGSRHAGAADSNAARTAAMLQGGGVIPTCLAGLCIGGCLAAQRHSSWLKLCS